MIDFRYHLVSLIAVFLAVALGIVIGTTQLNGPVLSNLQSQVTALQADKRSLENRTQGLQGQLDTSSAFEQAVAPALVQGSLKGHRVLLVLANDQVARETIDQVTALVGKAGGTLGGTITLQPAFSDPATDASLQNYVTGPGLPAGTKLPAGGDTGKMLGALLGQVLMVPRSGSTPGSASISSVLAGLSALKVLTQESSSVVPSDYAVVLTAGAFQGSDAATRNAVLSDLVTGLDAAGSGAVVAGDATSAGKGGLVAVIRNAPSLSAAVSTVDNIGTAAGQISTVLALGPETKGTSGKYGTGQDTQPVPPVPSSTP
ncbi:MAG: Copper transport outer membrane protein MctB [Blastococcus sp.]|nr:Copper transport outer membrane protein MctB [Blastococcus sp.]